MRETSESSDEVWCVMYGSGETSGLEKLVRDTAFTSHASSLRDDELVDWVAFALNVNVWRKQHSPPDPQGIATPPRVERGPAATRIDFWEWWAIGLLTWHRRHTVVTLEGTNVNLERGPMSAPIGTD